MEWKRFWWLPNFDIWTKKWERNCQRINKNNFLLFDGEYINGEKNGKGKEYSRLGKLIFEGEYLNGKKNGKGKEYYDNKLIFNGEYLNGRKWNGIIKDKNNNIYELKNGKGYLEINITAYIFYIGEYINGLINGKGKEYYDNKLIFEGEYLNGKRSGKGKEYYINDKLKFEGEYLYGHRFKGKEYDKNGELIYEGEYLYDQKWNGKVYDKKGNIISEFNNGNGKGKEYDTFGNLIFEGEFVNGKRNGKGKKYFIGFI